MDGEPRAFLYADGQWSDLGTLGALNATARALNNAREVTGDAIAVDNRDVAFLWTAETGMRELSRVSDGFVVGNDINNAGDVVGDGYSDHGPCCAFLARGGVARPIDEFLEPGSDWGIYKAGAINDSGQIAGYGCSNTHGCMLVRLDPVPEPAAYAMLLAGLGLLLLARRRVAKVAWPLALLTGTLGAAGPAAAAAPPSYTVTAYQPINAEARATEMNHEAHLIGIFLKSGGPWYDDGVESPFLSDGRQFTDIGNVMPGLRPAGMNNADHLAGTAVLGAQRRNRAYLYRDGMVSTLGRRVSWSISAK